MLTRTKRRFFYVLIMISLLMALNACQSVDELDVLRTQTQIWLSDATPVVKPSDVNAYYVDGMIDNYQVVSACKPEDFANGHLEGAINIFWKDIAKPESLAQLDKNKPIIVYCYTGMSAAIAQTGLNLMGYEAINMAYGLSAWNTNYMGNVNPYDCQPINGPIETEPNEPSDSFELPKLQTGKTTAEEIAQAMYTAYIAQDPSPAMPVTTLRDIINDATQLQNYQILSVRSAEDYAKGHIPGAINIFWKDLAKVENLKKLDPNKTIITYCYTGHTGGIAAAVLNLLGYDAINVKFGMMAWTDNDEILNKSRYNCDMEYNKPVVSSQ